MYWYEYWLKKKAKNDFEKDFFKLMNNEDFEKTMENVRKHRDIKLVTTERKSNYLVSEPNFYARTFFREHLLAIEMKKNRDIYEQACLFRTFNTRIIWNINAWVLV